MCSLFKPKGNSIEKPPMSDEVRKIYIDCMKKAQQKHLVNIHTEFYSDRFREERFKLYKDAYEQGKFDVKAKINNYDEELLSRFNEIEHRDIFNDIVE